MSYVEAVERSHWEGHHDDPRIPIFACGPCRERTRAPAMTLEERLRKLRDEIADTLEELNDPAALRAEIQRANEYRARAIREQDERLGHYGVD